MKVNIKKLALSYTERNNQAAKMYAFYSNTRY